MTQRAMLVVHNILRQFVGDVYGERVLGIKQESELSQYTSPSRSLFHSPVLDESHLPSRHL